jgi:integrase/recombinase XerD
VRAPALRTLVHAGATGVELMAISGHSSLDQVQEYLNEVDQERAADAAMSKLSTVPR